MVKSRTVNASEFVTQAEAAKLRGVSLAAINDLVRRGRLKAVSMFGKKLLKRADVLAFQPLKTGPKPEQTQKAKRASKKE